MFESQEKKDLKREVARRVQHNNNLYTTYKAEDKKRKSARDAFFKCQDETENDPTGYLNEWEKLTVQQLEMLKADEVGVLPNKAIKMQEHEQTLRDIEAFRNPPKWTQVLCEHKPQLKDLMEHVENLETIIEKQSGHLERRYEEFQKGAKVDLMEFKAYPGNLGQILQLLFATLLAEHQNAVKIKIEESTLSAEDQDTVKAKIEEYMRKGGRYNEIWDCCLGHV